MQKRTKSLGVRCLLRTRFFFYHLLLSVLFSSNWVFWKRIFMMGFSAELNLLLSFFCLLRNQMPKSKNKKDKWQLAKDSQLRKNLANSKFFLFSEKNNFRVRGGGGEEKHTGRQTTNILYVYISVYSFKLFVKNILKLFYTVTDRCICTSM